MCRSILIIFFSVAALTMTTVGFAQSLNTLPGDDSEVRIENQRDEILNHNTFPDKSDKAREVDSFANRFINPHPELGCLYYDENNARRWYPNCREL